MSKSGTQLWAGIAGPRFVDAHGRQLILRGVNLGGDSKLPYPDGGTERPTDFADHRDVSFVGRPFPLDEADEHLGRLRKWGFNTLRLVVTWEAVEHAGPGQYDSAYIDSIGTVCERARQHGLMVIVDFHQDVWSRMSGGSGAPCWLFDALGLDYTQFDAAGAVHVMQYRYDYNSSEAIQEDRYPPMSWPRNYHMPVNGILWTSFFAGRRLTPAWQIDGVNVQDFLWRHYFGAVRALAQRLRDLPNVIGFDSLNEPGTGWLGLPLSTYAGEEPSPLRVCPVWTPFDGLKIARGVTTTLRCPVADAHRTRIVGTRELLVNPWGVSIWKPGVADPYEQAGAWALRGDDGVPLNEDFFNTLDGRALDIEQDCMAPFFAAMAQAFREVRGDWLLFAELNPYATFKGRGFPAQMPANSVNASHWYDVKLLWTKQFPEQMAAAEREELSQRYLSQLGYMRGLGERINGGAPTLIGEFGTPYDLDHGAAFAHWAAGTRDESVWAAQAAALSLMYDTLDALQLSSTQWNYTATNANDLRIGDRWNQEDLSIFSPDQLTRADDPYSGARAAAGFCRVYARAIQGVLGRLSYGADSQHLDLDFEADAGIDAPTEIFLPPHFTALDVQVQEGDVEVQIDLASQCLFLRARRNGRVRLQAIGHGQRVIQLS